MQQDYLEQFISQLMESAGLNNLNEEFKNSYKERLMAQIQERLGLILMNELDEQGLENYKNFIQINNKPSPTQIQKFFSEHINDFEGKCKKALEDFAIEFLQSIKDKK
ncbi:MAG: hypothetical protein U9O55_00825 [Patescibacteria group bacterium]|nr:hypothetical protein [Patescibacteria group bacterium]